MSTHNHPMFPEKIEILINFDAAGSDSLHCSTHSKYFIFFSKYHRIFSTPVCLFATSKVSKFATNNLLYLKSTNAVQCYKIIQSETKEEKKKDDGISARNILSVL